jgi:hypothetical protein
LKISPPDVFTGNSKDAETFLSQLALYFTGRKIEGDERVIFALSYMKGGTAGPWAKLKVKEFGTKKQVQDWEEFLTEFTQVFGDPDPSFTARQRMDSLKQGNNTAEDYVASFREIKDETGFNDAALIDKFERGLNSNLVDKIYSLPEMPKTLDEWFNWSTKLDRQWRQRESKKKSFNFSFPQKQQVASKPTFVSTPVTVPSQTAVSTKKEPDIVPMEVDSGWKKVNPVICYKCRQRGHIAKNCKAAFDISVLDWDDLRTLINKEQDMESSSSKKDF